MRIKEKPTSIGDKKDLAKPAVDFWMSLDGGKVAKLGRKGADTLGVKTWPNKKSIPVNLKKAPLGVFFMPGETGKPRQTRLHVLPLAVKSHTKHLGYGRYVGTLSTVFTLQRVEQKRILQVLRREVRIEHCLCNSRMTQDPLQRNDVSPLIIKCVAKEWRSACVACPDGKSGLTALRMFLNSL